MGLAALYIGVPYAPLSPAYSLISSDFGKLRHIIGLMTPGLVFASEGHRTPAPSRRPFRPMSKSSSHATR